MVKGYTDPADCFSLFRNWVLDDPAGHRWYLNRVVTPVDDHDQVRKGLSEWRFYGDGHCRDRAGGRVYPRSSWSTRAELHLPIHFSVARLRSRFARLPARGESGTTKSSYDSLSRSAGNRHNVSISSRVGPLIVLKASTTRGRPRVWPIRSPGGGQSPPFLTDAHESGDEFHRVRGEVRPGERHRTSPPRKCPVWMPRSVVAFIGEDDLPEV
jgi:hypothetical protein